MAASNNPRRATSKTAAKRTVRKPVPKQPESVENEEVPTLEESVETMMETVEAMSEEIEEIKVKVRRLTIEEINTANDREEKELTIPEWNNGAILIRGLSAERILSMMGDDNSVTGEGEMEMSLSFSSIGEQVIKAGIVDPVVTDAGYQIIINKSAGPVIRIFQEIMKISNLRGTTEDGKPQAVVDEVNKFRPSGE